MHFCWFVVGGCERGINYIKKEYLIVQTCSSSIIIDLIFFFLLKLTNYTIKKAVFVCMYMIECVFAIVCICEGWVVGHLQLQAVYVCPNGKVLFSLYARRPQAVGGGCLFTLSLGTLFYGQYNHAKTHRHSRIPAEKS